MYPEQDAGEISLCSLSSCAVRRRGSPPARWQVLGKGRALAPGTPTCSQNRINTAHYPSRSSALVCALFFPNRIIIISACLADKWGAFWETERGRKIRKEDRMRERWREREREGGEREGEQKERKKIPRREKIGQPVWQHSFHMTLIWGIDKSNFELSRGALHVCDLIYLICGEILCDLF